MIYVIAELSIKPGSAEKAAAAARQAVAETNKEDGCIFYQMHLNVSDPTKLVVVERWESREALDAHLLTPHLKAWRAAGADFVTARKVEVIAPASVSGL
jgi:quinol monooxygenase YgiN